MARLPRLLSSTGVYHIVLKGNNSLPIFIEDKDYQMFVETLDKACDNYNVDIIAYCLMNNHIHLLLKFNEENMPNLFKSIGASFVTKQNLKYNKTGRMLNNRYYSKPVNDDEYLLAAVRYIHNNPVKAGICAKPNEYIWSSYKEYYSNSGICEKSLIESMLSKEQFKELHTNKDKYLLEEYMLNKSLGLLNDNDTEMFIKSCMEKFEKKDVIRICREAKIGAETISRVTGYTLYEIRFKY